jgi:hypothetical protein
VSMGRSTTPSNCSRANDDPVLALFLRDILPGFGDPVSHPNN